MTGKAVAFFTQSVLFTYTHNYKAGICKRTKQAGENTNAVVEFGVLLYYGFFSSSLASLASPSVVVSLDDLLPDSRSSAIYKK